MAEAEKRQSVESEGGSDDDAESVGDVDDQGKKRKSSFGFDEYHFESPLLEDNEDAEKIAQQNAEEDAQTFMQMTQLKTSDYSKMDMIRIASSVQGLALDENLVEPWPIPLDPEARATAVHEIYGADMNPESEPIKDPVQSLQSTEPDLPEKVQSPPNLLEAFNTNLLKYNNRPSSYRLFILGTHDEILKKMIEWNKEVVEAVNSQSSTDTVSGVLCVYEYFFIHVLEGTEDNLTKILRRYADDLEPSGYDWNLKFHHKSGRFAAKEYFSLQSVRAWVLGVFRIQQRQLERWRGEKVFPNRMQYADVPPGGFREKYFHFLRQCTVMAFTYNNMTPGRFSLSPDSKEDLTPQQKKAYERAKIQRFRCLGNVVVPVTFIQYVLDNKDNPKMKIRSIREHLECFGAIPPYVSPANTQWPPPCKVASYD